MPRSPSPVAAAAPPRPLRQAQEGVECPAASPVGAGPTKVVEQVSLSVARVLQSVGQDGQACHVQGTLREAAVVVRGLGQLDDDAVVPGEPAGVDADLAEREGAEELA